MNIQNKVRDIFVICFKMVSDNLLDYEKDKFRQ